MCLVLLKKTTCSFDVLREIGVCRLASNVCSSELKPGEQQSELCLHVDVMPSDSCLLALTRIRCLASKVRCISDCCCSLSRSHRSRRWRMFPPHSDCSSPWAAYLQTHPGCFWYVKTGPQMNKGGWGNLCLSGTGQDGQNMHSSSWWHSECPSLWWKESWRDQMLRDPFRSLLAFSPIFLSAWA